MSDYEELKKSYFAERNRIVNKQLLGQDLTRQEKIILIYFQCNLLSDEHLSLIDQFVKCLVLKQQEEEEEEKK